MGGILFTELLYINVVTQVWYHFCKKRRTFILCLNFDVHVFLQKSGSEVRYVFVKNCERLIFQTLVEFYTEKQLFRERG